MWGTADHNLHCVRASEQLGFTAVSIPHLAKNERDVGHPAVVVNKKFEENERDLLTDADEAQLQQGCNLFNLRSGVPYPDGAVMSRAM